MTKTSAVHTSGTPRILESTLTILKHSLHPDCTQILQLCTNSAMYWLSMKGHDIATNIEKILLVKLWNAQYGQEGREECK
jgi:hypothetical protein